MKTQLTSYFKIILIISILFSFYACKKYPDDHKISLQSAKKRLREHDWHLSKLFVNGEDSTMTHLHNIIPNSSNPSDFYFKVTKGLNYKSDGGEISFPFYPKPNSNYPDYTSVISINKKKTILKIGGGIVDNYNNGIVTPSTMNSILYVVGVSEALWEITKLTKTDLHFKTIYNNYEVAFEFKSN